MDLRKVKKLIELLEDSELTDLEISEGDESIRLSRSASGTALHTQRAPALPAADQVTAAEPLASEPATADEPQLDNVPVVSPIVGTYYASPNPDSAPYVEVGNEVSAGDTLCVIEAMKIFNQVDTDTAGIVRKIFKHSGDPVEYGETLFLIEASSP